MSRILVLGAAGNVGAPLSKALAARGHDVVRATSRTAVEPGQVHVNLVTREGLTAALANVEKAFLLSPPGFTNQDELLGPVIAEATARRLEKVVLMTAMGADADPSAPLRKAELQLESSGLSWNVVRPNWFMQNFNTYWLRDINSQGKIRLCTGKGRGSFIDARDVAAVAAELLDSNQFGSRAYDLTGPRSLDHDEVAAILSKETARDIRYEEISPDAMRQGLLAAELPAAYADFLVLILGYFKAGYSERTTDSVGEITGRAPIAFEQYARDYRSQWSLR